jgi:ribonuclease III
MPLQEDRKQTLILFQTILGYQFNELTLLNVALTHKSFANEQVNGVEDNERLEFLGDAVLNLIISNYFLNRYPDYPEGELTKLRASIVNNISLARMAQQIRLGDFILLGKGEERSGGRQKPSILANCFEAVIGALYQEVGLEKVYALFLDRWGNWIDDAIQNHSMNDYKSTLQEIIQREWGCIPHYQVIAERGPEHRKVFEVALSIKGQIWSCGIGRSKKEAEQEAAMLAIERFQKEECPGFT